MPIFGSDHLSGQLGQDWQNAKIRSIENPLERGVGRGRGPLEEGDVLASEHLSDCSLTVIQPLLERVLSRR